MSVWVGAGQAGKKNHLGALGPHGPARQVGQGSPPPPPPNRQQELLFHFLQLAAGVEHYQEKFRSQASVIDEIVDTAFEVNQAGPEGRAGVGDPGRPGAGGMPRAARSHSPTGV